MRAFNSALALCSSLEDFPNATSYRLQVLGIVGYTNRLFRRYKPSKDILEGALAEMGPSLERVLDKWRAWHSIPSYGPFRGCEAYF
jgi:hypothetical protein